jgi:hypothetical protein
MLSQESAMVLANSRNGLGEELFQSLLHQYYEEIGLPGSPEREEAEFLLKHWLRIALSSSLRYLSLAETISLFEAHGPRVIVDRFTLAGTLFDACHDSESPFLTSEQREESLQRYILFRQRNRDLLVRTGYPDCCFRAATWLDYPLAPVYPVKAPVSAFGPVRRKPLRSRPDGQRLMLAHGIVDELGNERFRYTWAYRKSDRAFGDVLVPCSYEEADMWHEFDVDEGNRLDQIRGAIVDLTVQVLRLCARWISGRAHPDVEGVVCLISDYISRDTVQLVLRYDHPQRHVAFFDELGWVFSKSSERYALRGLHGLLSIATDCYVEAVSGRHAVARAGIDRLRRINPQVSSYFQVAKHPEGRFLDVIIDQYHSGAAQESESRQRVWNLFARSLGTDLTMERVTVSFYEKTENAAETQKYVESAVREALRKRERGDSSASCELNRFERQGALWRISFDGKETWVEDRAGMTYIAILLSNSYQFFDALKLSQSADGPSGGAGNTTIPGLRQEGLHYDSSQPECVTDRSGIRAIDEERRRLEEQMKLAQLRDPAAVAEIARQLEAVRKVESGAVSVVGRRRRPRRFPDEVERVGKKIGESIRRSQISIGKAHPSLGLHLRRNLRKGKRFHYSPEQRTDWLVDTGPQHNR